MRWLEKLEARLHWLAVPGLFKWLTLLGVIVFAWQWVDPAVPLRIAFDRDRILSGEFWRLFSFAFSPAGNLPFSVLGVVFLFFATMIAFLISDSLEEVWGPTRTSLYLITAWAGLVVGQFILDPPPLPNGGMIYTSMFLAFATLFPTYEFRLFFIIPIQVRWLGWLAFGWMILQVLLAPIMICIVLPVLIPYGLWVLPSFLRERKALADSAVRRRRFNSAQASEAEPFHRCASCGRTEHDDPDLEFRTFPDGTEYCLEHLPETPTGKG